MPDYSTGKIYKVINPQNEIIYIGSTTQTLSQRFCRHEHKAIGNKIILLENCPCNSREELVKREQELIEQYDNLLNKQRAYMSEEQHKEYKKKYYEEQYQNNRDKILEKSKIYYEENKNKILENKKEYNKKHYQKNRDKILEYKKVYDENNKEKAKVYYEKNKNKILEKYKVKIICECGCEISKYNNKHKKSKKHIKLMESK